MNVVRKFLADEVGATSVEYGLIGAAIGLGIIGSLKGVKSSLTGMFGNTGTNLKPTTVN